MSFLKVENITAGYGGKAVVENISFSAEKGEITCILGANGSGKTTLMKALCGIIRHEGRIMLDGRDLTGLSLRQMAQLCGYIPQRSGIDIDFSLLDVVLMGFNPSLGLLERPGSAMIRQAEAALNRVGLGGRQKENYQTLSEGQKQLVILARTLVGSSRLLLLDEPESALDIGRRTEMLRILRRWAGKERGALLTLHDPNLALNGCDKLVLLNGGRLSAVLVPGSDSCACMEQALSELYGSVTLRHCTDKTGKEHLVMLKEDAP